MISSLVSLMRLGHQCKVAKVASKRPELERKLKVRFYFHLAQLDERNLSIFI
jgi:hypothetical protein